jgi:hypothetical protein
LCKKISDRIYRIVWIEGPSADAQRRRLRRVRAFRSPVEDAACGEAKKIPLIL